MVVWFRIQLLAPHLDPGDYEWNEVTLFSWTKKDETIRWYDSENKTPYEVDKWPVVEFYNEMDRDKPKETAWRQTLFPKGLMNHWLKGGHIGTYEDSIKALQGNGKG